MSFKPHGQKTYASNEPREFTPQPRPEEGSQIVQVGLLVDLGLHRKLPKFAKDSKGQREQDETGKDKIIYPKEGDKGQEHKVAAYVDLLNETHDFGEINGKQVGVKNIRIPLHKVNRAVTEGLGLNTVAPRDPKGNYIKGKPWSLAPASMWYKIAGVTKDESGTKLADIIFDARFDNDDHNNIALLLGRPYVMEVQVKVNEVTNGDKTIEYVNVSLKSPVSLMKGMQVPEALTPALSVMFHDTDLLEPKEELGGSCKLDLVRIADLRKIVLAANYEGSEIQKAIQAKHNEAELIKDAKEREAKNIAGDKDLQEIYKLSGAVAAPEAPQEPKAEPKQEPKQKPKASVQDPEDMSDVPF